MLSLVWAGVPTDGDRAVTSYVIEVGSDRGRSDLARIDTGINSVTYSHPAANGTYYIRILAKNACGLSAPSPEAGVEVTGSTAAGQPAARAIVGNGVVMPDVFGDVMVIGEVRGALGGRPTPFVKVTATFEDQNGAFIATDFTYVQGRSRRLRASRIIDDTTVAPGESACFLMYTSTPAANVARTLVSVTWSTSELEPLKGLVAVDAIGQEADVFGDLKVQGQLRNAGTLTTYFNQVHLEARDDSNRVIDCDFTYVTGSTIQLPSGVSTDTALAPGQAGPFVNYGRADFSVVKRLSAWTVWQEQEASAAESFSWHTFVPRRAASTLRIDPKLRSQLRSVAIDRLRSVTD